MAIPRPNSIRSQLATALVLVVGATLILGTLALRSQLVQWLERDLDRELAAKAQGLIALTEQVEGKMELEVSGEEMLGFREGADDYFQLWSSDGAFDERSPSLRDAWLTDPSSPASGSLIEDIKLPSGRPGRAVRVEFVPRVEDDDDNHIPVPLDPTQIDPNSGILTGTLVLASSREELDARILFLDRTLALFTILVLTVVVLAVYWALSRGLAPLVELADTVETLDEGTLGEGIRLRSTPSELAPVVAQLNALTQRLDSAVRRERLLSSNLAHELRTPLAELQSLADVAAEWPEDRDAVRNYFADVRSIGSDMQRIVEQLLLLARSESGRSDVSWESADLRSAVEDAWRWCGGSEPLRWSTADERDEERSFCVRADTEKLAIILRNLLQNAREYKTTGSEVCCSLATTPEGGISVTISNQTADLEPGDLDVMFDRFWRKDPSRSSRLQTGLGLALVWSIAQALGIDVSTRLDTNSVFHFGIFFPEQHVVTCPSDLLLPFQSSEHPRSPGQS